MKKIIISLLAFVFVLAGCGGNAVENQEVAETLVFNSENTFVPDVNTEPFADYAREYTGQDIKYVTQSSENATDKLMLELGTKKEYHAIKSNVNNGQYALARSNNLTLDIKPYLEEFGQNILAGISEESWKSVTDPETGAIYGIPNTDGPVKVDNMTFFRKDILAKEKIAVPTNHAEFKDAVCTLADKGYQTPYAVNWGSALNDYTLLSSFTGTGFWWNTNEEGEAEFLGKDSRYLDYLNYMNELYECGGLGGDYETMTQEQKNERFVNGDSIFIEASWWDNGNYQEGLEALDLSYFDAVGIVPPLVDDNGKQNVQSVGGGFYHVTWIPAYMEDYAAQTIQTINKMYDVEFFENTNFGSPEQENETWAYCPGGEYKYTLPNVSDDDKAHGAPAWFQMGTIEKYAEASFKCDMDAKVKFVEEGKTKSANDWAQVELNKYTEFANTYVTGGVLGNELWNKSTSEMQTLLNDFTNLYVTGNKTEADVKAFTDNLETKFDYTNMKKEMNEGLK